MTPAGNIWVCVDCYFAHHYGITECDGCAGHEGHEWYAGESDTPADRKPLGQWPDDQEFTDNTDSETGEGIDGFTWRSCDGCGSTLGGSRYRLAWYEKEPT